MNTLRQALADYLAVRRVLGYKLARAEKLLAQEFVVRFIPKPYPYVRASTHLFNTEEELEALVEAVSKL